MKKTMMKVKKKIKYLLASMYMFLVMGVNVFAAAPNIVTGTKKLLEDGAKLLLGILLSVVVIYLIVTGLRWYAAPEEEKRNWYRKFFTAFAVGIFLLCASGVVTWVFAYYQ